MSPRSIPESVIQRLAKILPMLLSENEAEQLATVRAIKATLAGAGCDLHDFAAHVENGGGASFLVVREPFRWPDPPSPTAAEREAEAEAMRKKDEAWAKEFDRREEEKAAKRAAKYARTMARNRTAKARCEGIGDGAPTWKMLLEQPNRITLILQWLDWFVDLPDINPADRERVADIRQGIKFDRLGMSEESIRRFNGWLVRAFNHRRKAEFTGAR